MDILGLLSLFGGLALFLYGMNLMGKGLERQAGSRLQSILERLTSHPLKGFLLGAVITAVIQSSSATTVMVIGFVNSGTMQLQQATSVIIGSNVGTTVTSWLLSLSGIEGSSLLVRLLKPTSFSPVLAMAGVIMIQFVKSERPKNTGSILLGFAILMFGMDMMSDAVKPLADVPAFTNLFTIFSNPVLGVLMGAILTAVLQSSSASVGILQALSATGAVTYASAIPIVMGQNIGTCATALLSSIGTNKNARRAAMIHLYFNVIGVTVLLTLYLLVGALTPLDFSSEPANTAGIALIHTAFNLLTTLILLPFSRQLEHLARISVREGAQANELSMPDERLLNTPAIAVEQSRRTAVEMAHVAVDAVNSAFGCMEQFNAKELENIRRLEDKTDQYEDLLGTYLVRLSEHELTPSDSRGVSALLHMIGDIERLADHAVSLAKVAGEIHGDRIPFPDDARSEIRVLALAAKSVLELAVNAFEQSDLELAMRAEPLEKVVVELTKQLRSRHIERLQQGVCTIRSGFVLSDLLNNCARIAAHSANIAATMIETSHGQLKMHDYSGHVTHSRSYQHFYEEYRRKFSLPTP